MKKDIATLEKVGMALFGNIWQTDLARELEINDRTVRRWVSGDQAIGDWVWDRLPPLCRSHAVALIELAEKLPASDPGTPRERATK